MIETLLLHTPEAGFVRPYIREALPGVALTDVGDAGARPGLAVMIASTDIYLPSADSVADEKSPVDTASPWVLREEDFRTKAAELGLRPVILRCPDIIGTGMTGFPRHLVETIWRGTFFHFPDNEARRSVVHAVDIARVVAALAAGGVPDGSDGIYNITDGEDPTIHDLAEALAFRLRNKRISNLSTGPQRWFGRLFYGRRLYGEYTTTRIFSSAKLCLDLAFRATPVCNYLRTHNYDDD